MELAEFLKASVEKKKEMVNSPEFETIRKQKMKESGGLGYTEVRSGDTLYHIALTIKDSNMIKTIYDGISPDMLEAENEQKRTPLFLAVLYGNKDVVDILLKKGANRNHVGKFLNDRDHNTKSYKSKIIDKFWTKEAMQLTTVIMNKEFYNENKEQIENCKTNQPCKFKWKNDFVPMMMTPYDITSMVSRLKKSGLKAYVKAEQVFIEMHKLMNAKACPSSGGSMPVESSTTELENFMKADIYKKKEMVNSPEFETIRKQKINGDTLYHLAITIFSKNDPLYKTRAEDMMDSIYEGISPEMLEAENDQSRTPLFLAVLHANTHVVDILLKKGANINHAGSFLNKGDLNDTKFKSDIVEKLWRVGSLNLTMAILDKEKYEANKKATTKCAKAAKEYSEASKSKRGAFKKDNCIRPYTTDYIPMRMTPYDITLMVQALKEKKSKNFPTQADNFLKAHIDVFPKMRTLMDAKQTCGSSKSGICELAVGASVTIKETGNKGTIKKIDDRYADCLRDALFTINGREYDPSEFTLDCTNSPPVNSQVEMLKDGTGYKKGDKGIITEVEEPRMCSGETEYYITLTVLKKGKQRKFFLFAKRGDFKVISPAKTANPQGAGGLRSLRSVANPQEGVRSVPSVPSVRRKERMPSYLLQAITKKKPAHPKYSNLRY
jgi:hypothetical protein